jgi:ABC-type branched-subunit amino acid transport system ATPase component
MAAATADLPIRATGLNTYYGASHILRGVDFTVQRGETIGLMGRNGMGKSTLLKSIMGLVKPRAGAVEIMGKHDRAPAVRGGPTRHRLCARRAGASSAT